MKRETVMIAASIFAAGLSTTAVAGPSVTTQAAPGVNFSAYKTYTWVPVQVPAGANPVMFQEIMNDIDSALAQKGYQKAQNGGDLTFALVIGAQEKTDIQSWGWWGRQLSVNQYTQGQLSLDALDTKTQQPVWHGYATETVDPAKPNPAKIDAAVMKLMTAFPATAAPTPTTPQR